MSARTGDGPQLPFFVYGTLRPGQRAHAWALSGRTAYEEPASLRGVVLYEGPGYPYAVVGEGEVHGDLVLPEPEHYAGVLAALDDLEDYTPGGSENRYERISAEAVRSGGEVARAWVYVAADPVAARLRATGTVVVGGDWVRDSTDPKVSRPA